MVWFAIGFEAHAQVGAGLALVASRLVLDLGLVSGGCRADLEIGLGLVCSVFGADVKLGLGLAFRWFQTDIPSREVAIIKNAASRTPFRQRLQRSRYLGGPGIIRNEVISSTRTDVATITLRRLRPSPGRKQPPVAPEISSKSWASNGSISIRTIPRTLKGP